MTAVHVVAPSQMLRLPAAMADELLAHARAELPNESCGLVAGDPTTGEATRFHPTGNADASPLRYSLHPEELVRVVFGIEADGEELLAIFHSHPRTPAVPSATDVRDARYPDAFYLIASLAEADAPASTALRAWRIRDGTSTEMPLELT